MTRYSYSLLTLVLSIFVVTAACQTMTGETASEQAYDTKITTSVKSHLATQDRLSTLTQINVKTVERTVYLTGSVPTQQDRTRAEELVRQVEGVQRVVNNVTVRQ